ncbi:hypothetical protein Hs30E_15060 [Lactococcus hodotermopsidis]|uniref:Uncharacterized protein n=1 Tax=Pseudolactococcus hodotermopsidis TaxID=2709157 RepID=A0A6A0BE43_9LACT|nr:XcbB/CpsF family capsular polysaccharide biosynthesis protein [Lactococcus hodotermopsidis]GFH42955.1 hypothetical protein Hs30E_15060 [Lactococcus hodotermopsidis]
MTKIEFFEKFEDDVKSVQTFSRHNNFDNYTKAKNYARQGYTLDGYNEETGEYRFVKLENLELGLEKEGRLHYAITPPNYWEPVYELKLLVMFPYFYQLKDSATSARERYFGNGSIFPNLKNSVSRNTYILEIADSNLMSGSFFMNTPTYPDYISDVQKLIEKVYTDLGVERERVVLCGSSRGGTAALIHALIGGYPAVCNEPLLSIAYEYNNDFFLVRDDIPFDLTDYVRSLFEQNPSDKPITLLSSSNNAMTWSTYHGLDNPRLKLIDIRMNLDGLAGNQKHQKLTVRDNPYFYANMNKALESFNATYVTVKSEQLSQENFVFSMPMSTPHFDFNKEKEALVIACLPSETQGTDAGFVLREPFLEQVTYEIEVSVDTNQALKFELNNQLGASETLAFEVVAQVGNSYIQKAKIRPFANWFFLTLSSNDFEVGQKLIMNHFKIVEKDETQQSSSENFDFERPVTGAAWEVVPSDSLISYLLKDDSANHRLHFELSESIKKQKSQFEVSLSVKSSADVTDFGLLRFNGVSVKRSTQQNLIAGEVVTMTMVINLAALPATAIGISSYNVPIGTQIDIVDVSIRLLEGYAR